MDDLRNKYKDYFWNCINKLRKNVLIFWNSKDYVLMNN